MLLNFVHANPRKKAKKSASRKPKARTKARSRRNAYASPELASLGIYSEDPKENARIKKQQAKKDAQAKKNLPALKAKLKQKYTPEVIAERKAQKEAKVAKDKAYSKKQSSFERMFKNVEETEAYGDKFKGRMMLSNPTKGSSKMAKKAKKKVAKKTKTVKAKATKKPKTAKAKVSKKAKSAKAKSAKAKATKKPKSAKSKASKKAKTAKAKKTRTLKALIKTRGTAMSKIHKGETVRAEFQVPVKKAKKGGRKGKGKGKGKTAKNPIANFTGSLTRKNPFHEGDVMSKINGNKYLRSANSFSESYLGANIVEVSSLVIVSALDSIPLNMLNKLKSIETMGIGGMVSKVASFVPAKYEAEAVNGSLGVVLHVANEQLLKRFSGKKSLVLESLAKALILKSLMGVASKMSPMSAVNSAPTAPAMSGLYYAPNRSMSGIITEPMAGNSVDFQGVDFEGVDFEGVDFEGIITEDQAMSGLVMEGDFSDEETNEIPDYTVV